METDPMIRKTSEFIHCWGLVTELLKSVKATANAKESIAWGTNIVGGVTPGKNGEHLGLPVLPTVREVGLCHMGNGKFYAEQLILGDGEAETGCNRNLRGGSSSSGCY
jgi:hypothetical protein